MELSEDDLRLIGVLQAAPRISWTDAARVLGGHPTSVAARWERLRSSGLAWITAHLIGDPTEMCLAVMNVDCDLRDRAAVTAALTAIPEVMTVEEAASGRDLILTVLAPTISALAVDVTPLLGEIKGLRRYRTVLCTRLHSGGHAWRLDVLTPSEQATIRSILEQERRPAPSGTALPRSHRDLLPFLARDGRVSAADIARELDRTPATVQRQLNRILADRILSFRCETAQRYSGHPITCVWFADVPPQSHDTAARDLRGFRNLRFSASTAGSTNFLIVMWLRHLSDVMSTEIALSQKISGIELVESVVVLGSAKRAGWLLNPDTTTTGEVVAPAAVLDTAG